MDRRGQGTPMEFAWDNQTGPVDESSPFIRSIHQQSLHKRSFAQYDSPSKPQSSSAFPNLRPAANQQFLFSDVPRSPVANKPLPPNPDRFRTPRKLEVDFSSGGETPETPTNADSEATPDSNMPYSFRGNEPKTKSPKKRRESMFSSLWNRKSPGPKAETAKPLTLYSKHAERRVVRKRARAENRRHKRDYESDAEDDSKGQDGKKMSAPPPAGGIHPIASILSYIESHPHLPHVLSFYLQLTLNMFLIFGFMWVLYSFWATIRSDVDTKAREASAGILLEIALCTDEFRKNRCEQKDIVPAMINPCAQWEKCMRQDPSHVGRARVSAHTFAEIFNSFIEPISYKAMIFSLLFVFGLLALCNLGFGIVRRQQSHDAYMQYPPPPPTPQRHPSGGQFGMYTPHHQPAYLGTGGQGYSFQGIEPGPSAAAGERSPSKMLEY